MKHRDLATELFLATKAVVGLCLLIVFGFLALIVAGINMAARLIVEAVIVAIAIPWWAFLWLRWWRRANAGM